MTTLSNPTQQDILPDHLYKAFVQAWRELPRVTKQRQFDFDVEQALGTFSASNLETVEQSCVSNVLAFVQACRDIAKQQMAPSFYEEFLSGDILADHSAHLFRQFDSLALFLQGIGGAA